MNSLVCSHEDDDDDRAADGGVAVIEEPPTAPSQPNLGIISEIRSLNHFTGGDEQIGLHARYPRSENHFT